MLVSLSQIQTLIELGMSVTLTTKLLQGYGRIFDAELRRQTCWKKLIR